MDFLLEISWNNFYVPIFGVGLVFLVALITSYGIAFLSKLFGIGVKTRSGQILSSPSTFDNINKNLSIKGKRIIEKIKNSFENSYNKIASDKVDKIDKLKELQELLKGGVINQEELEILKSEILNK